MSKYFKKKNESEWSSPGQHGSIRSVLQAAIHWNTSIPLSGPGQSLQKAMTEEGEK